jgi:hypothetical protein
MVDAWNERIKMSTEIKHIAAAKKTAIVGELWLTQFYGGKKNGLSMQFTVVGDPNQRGCPLNSRYVQLTKEQVRDLVRVLQNWLGENELFQKDMTRLQKLKEVFTDDY